MRAICVQPHLSARHFPINAGNPAKLGRPILLTEPGTSDYHDGVSDFVAVLPDGQFVFGSAVGPGLIPFSVLQPITIDPVVMPEGSPVNVTAYIDPNAGFPPGYTMYFQSVVPEFGDMGHDDGRVCSPPISVAAGHGRFSGA